MSSAQEMNRHLRDSDDNYAHDNKIENNSIGDISLEIIKSKPHINNSNKTNLKLAAESKKNKQNPKNNTESPIALALALQELDSKNMKQPIIKKDVFTKSLTKSGMKNIDIIDLKLLDYQVLKEIIENCGSYPDKFRNYVWRYLLSLPNNKSLFELYYNKGIHPFYKNLAQTFPIKDQKYLRKMQQLCSAITYWSPHIGNVYFLPNFVFPFIKSIKGDDIITFEIIIAFFNSFGQYWFEYYPGAPLNHLKICEKIIEKENSKIFKLLKTIEEENDITSLKISEIIWRMFKNNFSENLIKENWLQYMDFILTYNHKPEILFYFAVALIIKNESLILKCRTKNELENILFGVNKNLNLHSVMMLSIKLMDKYSKYQMYKYKPYTPFPENEYLIIDKFPLDFLQTTADLREQLFKESENFQQKEDQIDQMEKKFNDLLKKEEMMQKAYESLIHKEKEKANIMKRELDLILYQKTKFYDELKNKKLEKVEKLSKLINKSVKFYDKMNDAELIHFTEEMRQKKIVEEFDIKTRLQQEELNNIEFESNRKMLQLLNLRNKDEEDKNFKSISEHKTKDRELMKRLLEEKWKLEDLENTRKLDNTRNLKEFELIKKKDFNETRKKEYAEKLNDFNHQLLFQEVERERQQRQLQNELEWNRYVMEEDINKKQANILREEKTVMQSLVNKELDNTIGRKKFQYEKEMKKIKENLIHLENEERHLENENNELQKKEFQKKIYEVRKNGELKAMADEREFQNQLLRFEEERRAHLLKREEIEMRKKDLDKCLSDISRMKDDEDGVIEEQRNNFKTFKTMYDQETQEKINKIRNENIEKKEVNDPREAREKKIREDNENLYKKYLSPYEVERSNEYLNSQISEKNTGNLRLLNNGIRNLSGNNKQEEHYKAINFSRDIEPEYYTSGFSKNNQTDELFRSNQFSNNYNAQNNRNNTDDREDSEFYNSNNIKIKDNYHHEYSSDEANNSYNKNDPVDKNNIRLNSYSNVITSNNISGNDYRNDGEIRDSRNIQSLGSLSLSESYR